MRTTIDLPDDLHRATRALAHDRHQSFSATLAELVRRGLQGPDRSDQPGPAEGTSCHGFPTFEQSGRMITAEDVRALDDGA